MVLNTLSEIAEDKSTTVEKLVELNHIQNPDLIFVDQVLELGDVKANQASKAATKPSAASTAQSNSVAPATPAPATKVETKAAATPAPAAVAQETPKVTQTVAKTAAPAVTQAAAPAATATTQVASSSKGAAIYQAALAQLGKYQDCTMLVTNALKAVGINFHDWPAGYMSLGTVVPASQAQPGDLIYYANGGMGLAHIAVYAGNGQAVHGGWNGNQTVLNVANLGSGPVYIRVK